MNIEKIYSYEINLIVNKLNQLKDKRIYEISGCQGDGYLATNVLDLEKYIADLLYKIDNNLQSTGEKLRREQDKAGI